MSKIITGLVIAIVGSIIGSFALSDSCSSEIMSKLTPVISSLPGIALAWWARFKQGDITKLGFKK